MIQNKSLPPLSLSFVTCKVRILDERALVPLLTFSMTCCLGLALGPLSSHLTLPLIQGRKEWDWSLGRGCLN